MHAQLALIALDMDIGPGACKMNFIRHSSAAARLIRNRLAHSNQPDDQLIGAVALLLIAEVFLSKCS
jgi:hypothetical protein